MKTQTDNEKATILYERIMGLVFSSGVNYATILGTLTLIQNQLLKQIDAQVEALSEEPKDKNRPAYVG